jgi:hypothetical protein
MKSTTKPIVGYLRELSIVAAGVAITLGIGNLISSHKNRKDLEQHLEAVKHELQENVRVINNVNDYYKRAVRYSDYLSDNELKNLHPDTVEYYHNSLSFNIPLHAYTTNAFESLKASGLMRLIDDQGMLRNILQCYSVIVVSKDVGDFYLQRKVTILERHDAWSGKDIDPELLFGFFTMGLAEGEVDFFDYILEGIEKTIALFEER